MGSGYGASIAASRCARAGQRVCVLERGREWLPGDFPETFNEARKHFQINHEGKPHVIGNYLLLNILSLSSFHAKISFGHYEFFTALLANLSIGLKSSKV